MSPDPMAKLAKYAATSDLHFTLLSDPELAAITSWGLVNPQQRSLPDPTAVVVDENGVVRYLRRDHDYTHRPASSELVAAVKGLAVAPPG